MKSIEAKFRELYRISGDFYNQLPVDPKYGWSILRSPPKIKPPVLFIGLQGGFGKNDTEHTHIPTLPELWPQEIDYVCDDGPFYRNMRKAFTEEFLRECAATDAVFLHAPNERVFVQKFKSQASEVTRRSDAILSETIRLLEPRLVLVIGCSTFRRIGVELNKVELPDDSTGKWLLGAGKLRPDIETDRKVYVTFHFSGARGYSDDQRRKVGDFIRCRAAQKIGS